MATLQQLLAQIQSAQNSGTTMADPAAVVAETQTALLAQLVAAVTALQLAAPQNAQGSAATVPTDEHLQSLIAPMVSEAISAAFGRLESAAGAADVQPAVTQNTGSGAAPVAPIPASASNSAASTPAAAGTAPTAPTAQG